MKHSGGIRFLPTPPAVPAADAFNGTERAEFLSVWNASSGVMESWPRGVRPRGRLVQTNAKNAVVQPSLEAACGRRSTTQGALGGSLLQLQHFAKCDAK